ncbi:sensor histidine kinase [Mariprofundus ferrinatatus]
MGGITGNLYLAKKEALAIPSIFNKLEIAEELCFQMTGVIKQLITFTQKEMIEEDEISLNECVKEVLGTHKFDVSENISLYIDLAENDLYIRGSPMQIKQIVNNLLENAVDAIADVLHPAIQFESGMFEADDDFRSRHPEQKNTLFAHLEVKDNGTGIPHEDMEHIFEPFFTTKNKIIGQGLGLSVVYGLVQNHNGIIDINSSPGLGTSVHIYLPLIEKE